VARFLALTLVIGHVGKEGKWIVPLEIWKFVRTGIASRWNALSIRTPAPPGSNHLAYDVIYRNLLRIRIVIRDDLAGGLHKVVADRRMRVGEKVSRQPSLLINPLR